MSISRHAMLGLVCLLAGGCTVVVQPAPQQPQPTPPATEPEADVDTVYLEPDRTPPLPTPRRRPANPDPDPEYDEPNSPSRRPPVRGNRLNLGIPPGHLPAPGECRVWVPGTPPGLQARARSCNGILATAPAGSWILYRPPQYERQVRVRYLHGTRQVVVAVRAFDVETGVYLRDFALEADDDNMGPTDALSARRPDARPAGETPENRGNSGNAPGRTGTQRGRLRSADDTTTVQVTPDPSGDRRSDRPDIGVAVRRGDTTDTRPVAPVADRIPPGQDDTSSTARATRRNVGGSDRQGDAGGGARGEEPREVSADPRTVRGREVTELTVDSNAPPILEINSRYFPRAGQCRVWVPGLAFGRQARPADCDGIVEQAPPGAWILRRSSEEPDVILVDYLDAANPGAVIRTTAFDAQTGAVLPPVQRIPPARS